MKKQIIGLGIGAVVSAAAAGTAVGLYANNHTDNHKTKASLLSDIVERINGLPGNTNILTVSQFEDEVKKLISDRTNEINTMQQATVSILEKSLQDSETNTINYINSSITEHKDLFTNEITKHQTVLEEQIDLLSRGIVGQHDLNYYQTVLADSVDSSQFNELQDQMDALDTDISNEIEAIKTDLGHNKTDITKITSDLNSLTTATTGNFATVNAKIDAVKAEIDKTIAAEKALSGTNLANLEAEINTEITEIKRLLSDTASTSSDEIDALGVIVNQINTKVTNNALTIDELKLAQQLMINSNTELKNNIDQLTLNINKVESIAAGNTTEIASLQTSVGQLATELDTFDTKLKGIDNNFTNLTKRVEKNEADIKDLFNKVKNTADHVNTHIAEVTKYMIDTDKSIADLTTSTNIAIDRFDKKILLNEDNITKMTTGLDDLKTDVTDIKTQVEKNRIEIANFQNGINTINITIGDILNDVDDLALVVNANEGEILGLKARIDLLEANNNATSPIETIYSTASNKLFSLGNRFFLPQAINHYKQLQFVILDGMSNRYNTLNINVDLLDEVRGYAGGGRSHPNRYWYIINSDNANNSIWTSFYVAAGNASWVWHSNPASIWVKQIIGIK